MKVKKNREKSQLGARLKYKTLRQACSQLTIESPGFVSLFTRISTEPQIGLCDITGMKFHYVCPRTGIQFHSVEVYSKLREMSMDTALVYAKIRALGRQFNPFIRNR